MSSNDRLVVVRKTAGATTSAPMFNLIAFRGQLDSALSTSGATRGHSASAGAFSVAATPAAESFNGISPDGPFPGLFTASNAGESFSSDGPRRIILDGVTGGELTADNRTSTGGVLRQKPDITAADGVSTSAPGFSTFYGTSAAAPHAAAIAALLKSAVPSLTAVQVRTALTTTAIDIETTGVDRDTGAGIVMPLAALASAGATPRAFLSDAAALLTQVNGDSDGAVENYETFNIKLPLSNDGGASATAISAVLSSTTPGVTISAAASSYPDLASTATASNTTPFALTLDTQAICGAWIDFTLSVNYTGGVSPQAFEFSVPTGSAGAPVTIAYAGAIVPIPDGDPQTPAVVTLPVSGIAGSVFASTFSIDGTSCSTTAGATTVGIDHSWVSDLQLTLISPNGTPVLLVARAGGGGNNFCQTVLDDAATTSIQSVFSSQAPFTGTFSPNNALSTFRGEPANGNWLFQAQDYAAQDSGNIRAFSLTITPAMCDVTSDLIFANGFE